MKASLPEIQQDLDPALDAVLLSIENGTDWRESLSEDSHGEAAEWESLAQSLGSALRMGPGGLDTEQRETILDAACHPVFLHTGEWSKPTPAPVMAPAPPYKWLAGAAAVAALLLFGARHIPVSGGIRPDDWKTAFVPKEQSTESTFHVRLWPGENFIQNASIATNPPTSGDGDWSAVGAGGGFQPTAMANVSEVVPDPSATMNMALVDLLPSPIGAGRASTAALIQHFRYAYPNPESGKPLSFSIQTGPCPWRAGNLLVHVGIQATSDPRLVPGSQSLAVNDLRLLLDFNPSLVSAYRLVGYGGSESIPGDANPEPLRGADLLAGQSITAIYEIVPAGNAKSVRADRDKTRWKKTGQPNQSQARDELLAARVSYRLPGRAKEFEAETLVRLNEPGSAMPRDDFEFAAAVAACALLLERAPGMQHYRMEDALALAKSNIGTDSDGRRSEFVRLLGAKKGG